MHSLSLVVSKTETDVEILPLRETPFADSEFAFFGIIEKRSARLLEVAIARHISATPGDSRLTVILETQSPPLADRRSDAPVESFLASPDLFRAANLESYPANQWCYEILRHALARPAMSVDIQVVHKSSDAPVTVRADTCETILCHRGPERYLRLSVDSLLKQSHPTAVSVGVDQKYPCRRFLDDVREKESVGVFQLFPHPVGVYVALHLFGLRSQADYIARQDSDDVSLARRLATLLDLAKKENAGIVGSHELQLNEVTRQVVPVRYPLDANESLRKFGPGHQTLLATAIIRPDVFRSVGGFSTHRIFSLDVDFWLKASLGARIVNVDEFLYVRRRRSGSLTMRPDIGNDSAVRKAYRSQRETDFEAVAAGRLRLENSSLAIRHRTAPVEFHDLITGRVENVLLNRLESCDARPTAP